MEERVKKDIPEIIHQELSAFPDFLRKLLFYRNIKTNAEAEFFLNPVYVTHDPFLMKGMEEAVARFLVAIENDEHTTIFSDYDADGIPGAVVLYDFFKKIGYENFDVYIPDRHAEGFGLNDGAIKEIAGRGTKLIITVDCGIADAEEIDLANELGIDVVVTDHHTPTGAIPRAVAIVDPKQADCHYPFKELCGAGVAFKFVQAVISKLNQDFFKNKIDNLKVIPFGWEKWLLDMVGIATLSDMVPLIGENRVLAKFGLMVLRKTPRPGLNALFSALRLDKRFISEDDIVFSVSPRLNAASRMGDPMDAFRLLTTNDEVEAVQLAKILERLNRERKGVVASVIKEIRHIITDRGLAEKGAIVIGNPIWKPPILGLVAGNIAEEFDLPVFLWGRDTETTLKGSCRSGGGINILELMEKAGNVFIEYGGHAGAGGFSVSFEKVHRLEEEILKAVADCKKEVENENVLADALLRLNDANRDVFSVLSKLSPFGEGNPKPIFLIGQVMIEGVRSFGKENAHTAIRFAIDDQNFIEAISFFKKPEDFSRSILPGERISLLAHIEQSNFNGNSGIRLRIKDIL